MNEQRCAGCDASMARMTLGGPDDALCDACVTACVAAAGSMRLLKRGEWPAWHQRYEAAVARRLARGEVA